MRGLPIRRWTVLALLVACRAPAPPRPDFDVAVEAPGAVRSIARVRVESERLAGSFQAVLVRRSGPDPAVRLQLFPDLGGKLLDLGATGRRVWGSFPQAGIALDWRRASGERAPRHLLTFLALSLLEEERAPSAEDLRAARWTGESWAVALAPLWPGVRVVALYTRDGHPLGREYRLGGVRWSQRGSPPVFRGRDFLFQVESVEREALTEVSEALFDPPHTPESESQGR